MPIRAVVAVAILSAIPPFATARRPADQPPPLLVSAAASLTDAMGDVTHRYERSTGVRVTLNVGASSALARQVVSGAPVDVFLSADQAQMDVVARAGRLVPGTRFDLLLNQLVVVEPSDRAKPLATIRDLAAPGIRRIAAANPDAVPAGVYAKRYLESQQIWTAIQPKIVPTLDVRAALAAVDGGNVDAAFVYRTDAAVAKRATVVFRVAIADGPRITYPAAAIVDSPRIDAARRFLAYLRGPEAAAVFERLGFITVEAPRGR